MSGTPGRRLVYIVFASVIVGIAAGLLEYVTTSSLIGAVIEGITTAIEVFKSLRKK